MADEPTVESLQADLAALTEQFQGVVKDRDGLLEQKRNWKADQTNVSAGERAELEDLRAKAKAADEENARRAGQWDKLKADKDKEVSDVRAELQAERDGRIGDWRRAEFDRLQELFGSNGKTILTPRLAHQAYGDRVKWEPGENGTAGRFVVHDSNGEPILENGEPASLAVGLERVVMADPEKDAILRGNTSVGSGAQGGHESFNIKTATRAELAERASRGDRDAMAALRASQPAGQISGRFWEKKAAQAK